MLTVPELRGLYYVEAQQALLAAGFGITTPTWVINPGPDTSPATQYQRVTIDTTSFTIDSTRTPVDSTVNRQTPIQRPMYVLQQSLPSGTQVPSAPLVVIALTVIGIPVPIPGGAFQAVP